MDDVKEPGHEGDEDPKEDDRKAREGHSGEETEKDDELVIEKVEDEDGNGDGDDENQPQGPRQDVGH